MVERGLYILTVLDLSVLRAGDSNRATHNPIERMFPS